MLTVPQTAALLRTFDNILILTHVRPDGDTVGCAAALCAGLRSLGKTAFLLPNPELTDTTAPYFRPYEAPECFTPDKVVSTDIATVGLFPENARPYAERVDLAIDHHPSFESFGRENIVRPEAAACGELIYDILSDLGPITPEMALPLYVAVSTDTGCFAYANTTAQTHAVAAALLRTGIDYQTVNKVFFRTKSRRRMQLEAAILNDCTFYDRDRVAVLSVPPPYPTIFMIHLPFRTARPYRAGRSPAGDTAHCRICRGRIPAGAGGSVHTPPAPTGEGPCRTAYQWCRR